MKKNNLIGQIAIAFVLAIIFGTIFSTQTFLVQPLGEVFLRLIEFIMVPLILSTLVVGVVSSGDSKNLGRNGFITISYFLVTTIIATSIGLLFLFNKTRS